MEYRFKVKKCENCLLHLTGVEPEDVAERGGKLTGYCPKCYVVYPVVEVTTGKPSSPGSEEGPPEQEPPPEE